MCFLAGLHLVEQGVKTLEIGLPDAAIPLSPSLQLLQRRWAQGIDSTLRVNANVDQAGIAEHAQMLGDLRLAKTEAVDQIADGARAVEQQFDDLEAVGLGQR